MQQKGEVGRGGESRGKGTEGEEGGGGSRGEVGGGGAGRKKE